MFTEISVRFVGLVFRILVRFKISKWPPRAHVVGKESDIYGKLIELERRLNHYKFSGINPFPAAQETLSGIEKTLLSDRFWIDIANQKNGLVRQEEARTQKSNIASQKNGVFRQEETPPKLDSQNEH